MSDISDILEPVLGQGKVSPCTLCKRPTCWTVNGKPLCPPCHLEKGLIGELWPGCEVCGEPSEWRTGKPDAVKIITSGPKRTRFTCWKHRDHWFAWTKDHNILFKAIECFKGRGHRKEWDEGWQKIFDAFVAEAKGEITVCPYCGQTIIK